MIPHPEHCCEVMTDRVNVRCDRHDDPFDCPDALVDFIAKFQEYGLIIHDGGRSSITIEFCPWCGRRLPGSQRDRWFDELERRGVDPGEDEVPADFQDGRRLTSPRREQRTSRASRDQLPARGGVRRPVNGSVAGRGPGRSSRVPYPSLSTSAAPASNNRSRREPSSAIDSVYPPGVSEAGRRCGAPPDEYFGALTRGGECQPSRTTEQPAGASPART
ncbi:DUF6980 family protein [Streptomyces sp. NPDC002486]